MTNGQKIAAAMSAAMAISMLAAGSASAEVSNYRGHGNTRSAACSDAKFNAERSININNRRLERFGSCDCSEDRSAGNSSDYRWNCSVDAYYHRR